MENTNLEKTELFNIIAYSIAYPKGPSIGNLENLNSKAVSVFLEKEEKVFNYFISNKHILDLDLGNYIEKGTEIKDLTFNEVFKIRERLDIKRNIYFNKLVFEIFTIQLESSNKQELDSKLLQFLNSNFKEHLEYLRTEENEVILNELDELRLKIDFINNQPFEIVPISVKQILEKIEYTFEGETRPLRTYFNAIKEIKAQKKKTTKQLVKIHKDRILELNSLGLSYSKIRDILSSELHQSGELERTIERVIRTKGSKGQKEIVPLLIPISEIVYIIETYGDLILE